MTVRVLKVHTYPDIKKKHFIFGFDMEMNLMHFLLNSLVFPFQNILFILTKCLQIGLMKA